MIKKGYKLVLNADVGLRSVCECSRDSAVLYLEGKWVEPREDCGPLGLFETYVAAEAFRMHKRNEQIYECEYEPSEEKIFWRDGGIREHDRKSRALPFGTVFAKRVKLLKRVK